MSGADLVSTREQRYRMYVGGAWVPAADGGVYPTVNPYTGTAWANVPDGGAEDVDRAVRAARAALDHGPWRTMSASRRGRLLTDLSELLERDAERLAEIETRDNGKLLRETRAQMHHVPGFFRYFGGAADKLEGAVIPADHPGFLVYTRHEPVGVVGAIIPWNVPLLLLAGKVAPALAAGCTVVIKPSEHTPASALELARLAEEAGFPPGVVNVVTGWGPPTGAALAAHPLVDRISFTGSDATGREVVKAGVANLTRVILELGGKSPNLVFADADLDSATNGIATGIFGAGGQSCLAGSRLLVQREVHDELVDRLVARADALTLGDPMAAATDIGPMAMQGQFDKVVRFFDVARAEGASVAAGGVAAPDAGPLFVRPTVLTRVRNDMRVAQDEIFGPVLSVVPFRDEEEAVRLANDTRFGLAAAVWTRDIHRAHRVAHEVRAGTVWVNAYRTLGFNVPFGGYRDSGWGRENGFDAMREYTETKSVWVETSGSW